MKLSTWNCQGGFRNKAHRIIDDAPDVLIIQECEPFAKLGEISEEYPLSSAHWFGDSAIKGLAVFVRSPYALRVHPQYDPNVKGIVPLIISSSANGLDATSEITLFAVWTGIAPSKRESYIGQIWTALECYRSIFKTNHRIILAGDFNSNTIWDKEHKGHSHSLVVERLASHDIHSIYHLTKGEQHGEETQPTFHLQKKTTQPFHIDYIFASAPLLSTHSNFTLAEHSNWLDCSDHLPMTVRIG
jgi:exodeoxyribonuclease-3